MADEGGTRLWCGGLVAVSESSFAAAAPHVCRFHRREVVERIGDGSSELAFTESVLHEDAKNYHAWSHRQWAIQRFSLWDTELDFAAEMIRRDIRNNSAWNQRWFVLAFRGRDPATSSSSPGVAADLPFETVDRELSFVLDSLEVVVGNESAWNYLRGFVFGGWGRGQG